MDSVKVKASGVVNGCSCRDVDNQLKIRDLNEQPLEQILSPTKNPRYRQLIEEQEASKYRDVCKNCDFYRSIYHQPKVYRKKGIKTQTLAEFLEKPLPKYRC